MDKEFSFIFDLDGTLWDSRAEVAKSWQEIAIKEFGKTHVTVELVASLMGKPMKDIALAIAPEELSEEKKLAFGERAFLYENEYLSLHPGKPFEGVVETLKELRKRGHRLFIVSNCQNGYIETFTNVIKPFEFDGTLCYGETGTEKSLTMRELMKRHGVNKAIYVGDTLGDEVETKKAGLPFVYAAYGFGKSENPDYIIHRFSDLLALKF